MPGSGPGAPSPRCTRIPSRTSLSRCWGGSTSGCTRRSTRTPCTLTRRPSFTTRARWAAGTGVLLLGPLSCPGPSQRLRVPPPGGRGDPGPAEVPQVRRGALAGLHPVTWRDALHPRHALALRAGARPELLRQLLVGVAGRGAAGVCSTHRLPWEHGAPRVRRAWPRKAGRTQGTPGCQHPRASDVWGGPGGGRVQGRRGRGFSMAAPSPCRPSTASGPRGGSFLAWSGARHPTE